MRRKVCFALDLRNDADAIAEYERIHAPGCVWPEVIADLRASGFEAMSIWRTGSRLFMIAEMDPPAALPTYDAATQAVLDRWRVLTQSLQQALPGTGTEPRWIEMHCVFDLAQHSSSR